MMHIAYPNVHLGQFVGCGRYLSLPPGQAPGEPYHPANPRTPNRQAVYDAVEALIPERGVQFAQGTLGQVYEKADKQGAWQGTSLDLAYLLALVRCSRQCVLEACMGLGDVWCTGEIGVLGDTRSLRAVDPLGFEAKLRGFLAQVHDGDRLFLVPAANVFFQWQRDACDTHQVQILTLVEFGTVLAKAQGAGESPAPAVVLVGTRELRRLVATLFAPPPTLPRPWSDPIEPSQRPYKFLDAFGPADAALFCGRDQDIERLQRMLTASRLLILYGASGTGKTSVLQAGLLPSLPAERYAWILVRMVDDEPTAAIKAALVREFAVDAQILEQPLLDGVHAATTALGKTIVIILDQFEEFFQRHARAVRQQLHDELRACLDAIHLEVRVVIALREDYLAHLAEFQEDGTIPTIFHHTMRLTRFSPAQAYDAVVQPAQRLGLSIDAALVKDRLIPQLTDAEHTVELPLLQIVCDVWYQRAEAHQTAMGTVEEETLGEAAYEALGDIPTFLGRYLDDTLRQFGQEQAQAREVLKALVTAEDTQRAVFLDELLSRLRTAGIPLEAEALEQRMLRRLVQARLVRATDVEGRTRYELIHEFLVARIAAWITPSERERTKVLELFVRAYEVYVTTGLLLSPEALAMIGPWQEELVLPDAQRAFLVRSQQRARQQRRGLWLRVVGLVVTAISLVLLLSLPQKSSPPEQPRVNIAASYDVKEVIGILEDALGAKIALDHQNSTSSLVRQLEERVAAGTVSWDLISVDNDTLGILVQKGLVQNLSKFRPYEKLIPGTLLDPLKNLGPREDGSYYFVPFHPNVQVTYYNQETLRVAGYKQPPATCEELWELAQTLASGGPASGGRVALQARPGKAAAVTVFELVTSMGGDPLTLADAGARQAFTCLWNLAPYLEPASTSIQFDTANNALITNEVALVDNWTYGIKVVMGDFEKTEIDVTGRWPGSKRVLGGDVLAIPTGVPPERKERAIKLIERLVAKETQRKLAERLYWAPVRQDVYDELPAEEGQKQYFEHIWKALGTADLRPITPRWNLVQNVLSDALQKVLEKGRAANRPANPHDIEALLQPYAAQLQKIREVVRSPVVARAPHSSDESCEPMVIGKSLERLAPAFKTEPDMLAKLNGRDGTALVNPENMRILLVPKPAPGN